LLRCSCENERITTHDTFQNIVVVIALENGAHVQREVSHLFLHHTQRQMDIVIIKNNFQTLAELSLPIQLV
jgi:hypothetical protein